MRYETPAAFRTALDQRLANAARDTGIDLGRLRRRVVFERILARLGMATTERWILKGGFALEVRLGERARATRDLDVALAEPANDGADVRDALIDTLSADAGDSFKFAVSPPRETSPDEAGRPGWRFNVTATLAGREFQKVRIDVVARPEEIAERIERVRVPTFLDFIDHDDFEVDAVDRRQHFAEKLHALTRDYGDRSNSRSKDLPDLLALIEDGLAPDLGLFEAVTDVFATRATHLVPEELPSPPAAWAGDYERFATEIALEAATLDVAHQRLTEFWSETRCTGTGATPTEHGEEA